MTIKSFDVIIAGGGVSGLLMDKRLKKSMKHLKVAIIDEKQNKIHPFHLHKPIDIPGLDNLKKVTMKSNIWDGKRFKQKPTVLDINDYALKTFDHIQVTNINNTEDISIYPIHKQALEELLFDSKTELIKARIVVININKKTITTYDGQEFEYKYLISTIPLPQLLRIASIEAQINFESYPFYTTVIDMPETNLYQIIYNSDIECHITRVTLLGDKLFIEANKDSFSEKDKQFCYKLFKVWPKDDLKRLNPGRIKPILQEQRKPLLHWLTEHHNIFTLGRYGVWSFKVTNDIWEDTLFISNLIYAKEQAYKFSGGNK